MHTLMLRTFEYIALYGLRDFEVGLSSKFRIFKWTVHSQLCGWAQSNHLGKRYVGWVRVRKRRCEDGDQRLTWCALKTEEGSMNTGIQATSTRWKRQGNRFSPEASRRNIDSPASTDFELLMSKNLREYICAVSHH